MADIRWYILKENEDACSYQVYDGIDFLCTIDLLEFDAFEFELKFSLLINQNRTPDIIILKCQDIDIVKPLLNIQRAFEKKQKQISLQRYGIPICRVKEVSLSELLAGAAADLSD